MAELKAFDLKAFVGTRDFGLSKAFYLAAGFEIHWESETLIEFGVSGCRFLLQDYYEKSWCENMMMHLTVEDAEGWYSRIAEVLADRKYGAAKTQAPQREERGALVTYFWDPSGVLWHIAQFD